MGLTIAKRDRMCMNPCPMRCGIPCRSKMADHKKGQRPGHICREHGVYYNTPNGEEWDERPRKKGWGPGTKSQRRSRPPVVGMRRFGPTFAGQRLIHDALGVTDPDPYGDEAPIPYR